MRHWPGLLALFLVLLLAPSARALDAGALSGFSKDNFSDTEKTIESLTRSGDPRALTIIEALQAGRLLFDPASGAIALKTANDALADAASGAALASSDGLKPVRVNNRIRRALESAQGALSLRAENPERRIAAAQSLFHSRDASALPALTAALAQEKDFRVAAALKEARAAIIAPDVQASVADRLAAIEILRTRGDQDSLALLSPIAASAEPGAIKSRAEDGARKIETRLALWGQAQNIWYGLSLGSVLLLAAIGLAITFGVLGVINMAHGEMVMIGAYVAFVVQDWIRIHQPSWFDASLFIAIPLAFLVAGAIGVLIERTIIRFLYGRPLETLLATFGLSLVLQQAVRVVFGANNREVGAPSFMSGEFALGGLSITYGRMWIVIFAAVVFFALQALLRATPFGLRMRAVTQNRAMASSMGISTDRVDALAFGLGSGIAGVAGVALSQIDNVSPNLGQSYIIDSFMVVVFGGVGNLWGTLVAALSLGVANKLLEPVLGAVLGKIALLVFIILFIQKRPRGLFALKGRAVES